MAHDPEFQEILDNLRDNPNAAERIKAANMLGQYVDELNDDEYEDAKEALTVAMTDSDPTVLMAVMQSMGKYNRRAKEEFDIHGDAKEDMIASSACSVCGRPEALIPDEGCERDNCPYA